MRNHVIFVGILLLSSVLHGQNRWTITPQGETEWKIADRLPHYDHIEMSGERVSTVLQYGVNADSSFRLERSMVWPMLRTIPNNTHASLIRRFPYSLPRLLIVNGQSLKNEKVKSIRLNGMLSVKSVWSSQYAEPGRPAPHPVIELTHTIFPSTRLPMLCERYEIRNISSGPISVNTPDFRSLYRTDPAKGVDGSYTLVVKTDGTVRALLQPGKRMQFGCSIQAYKKNERELSPDLEQEFQNRQAFIREIGNKLVFESPDPVVNTAFAFAKLRASESIYRTAGGLMHSPGGEAFYAAIWANDQAEYAGPFFPYLGYATGNEASLNAYLHFARFMNDAYQPIPSSIIAEGKDIWNGAGDRGDGAMIAYGASRYALVRGDRHEAEQLWPLIAWCLEYCKRKLNEEGVVTSDSDELEGRFPSGKANLCTSCLYYDALLSAAYVGKALNKPKSRISRYREEARQLRQAIDRYFGAEQDGFACYRYFEGNTKLRSWICIPLTVGIFDRAKGTIDALFSPRLWTENGLLTQEGSRTFWDRSTLYALRGVYAAGDTEKATDCLSHYSAQRLLGEHVPYPIEAWPEGSQRHLSAESALYCRIFTEGLFGIRPIGLNRFTLTPHLPACWNYMRLRHMNGFGKQLDISVKRKGCTIEISVQDGQKNYIKKKIKNGSSVTVKL